MATKKLTRKYEISIPDKQFDSWVIKSDEHGWPRSSLLDHISREADLDVPAKKGKCWFLSRDDMKTGYWTDEEWEWDASDTTRLYGPVDYIVSTTGFDC